MIEHYKDDVSTVFSIVPYEVFEFKPGLYPGSFRIPACLNDKEPEMLFVGASEHLMSIGGRKEPIRIITPSYQIANSIVTDFLDGQLWTSPEEHPGIAWIQGKITKVDFFAKHKEIYDRMKITQKNWFVRICKQTDNEWKKTPNYRVVTDQARFAAQVLGLNPEWLRAEEVAFTFGTCPACSTKNDPRNAVCTNCKCILDKKKYETLAFAS